MGLNMKTLLILCLALGGCVSKPKPMWDWCVDTPTRQIKCADFKANPINQDHVKQLQREVGISPIKVRVVK